MLQQKAYFSAYLLDFCLLILSSDNLDCGFVMLETTQEPTNSRFHSRSRRSSGPCGSSAGGSKSRSQDSMPVTSQI
jgi:hypothetical protein